MAETIGFEPTVPLSEYNDLANRRLQPLGHVSGETAYKCHDGETQGLEAAGSHFVGHPEWAWGQGPRRPQAAPAQCVQDPLRPKRKLSA